METNARDLVNNIGEQRQRGKARRGRSFAGQLPVTSAIRTQLPFYPIALISFWRHSLPSTTTTIFSATMGTENAFQRFSPSSTTRASCSQLRLSSFFLTFYRSTSFNGGGKIWSGEKSVEITTHDFFLPAPPSSRTLIKSWGGDWRENENPRLIIYHF